MPSAGPGPASPTTRCASSRRAEWFSLCGRRWGAPGMELAYNVGSPEEVAQVLDEARRAGGAIVRGAPRAEGGGITGAFADVDGYVWEVAHNPGWTLAEDGTIQL